MIKRYLSLITTWSPRTGRSGWELAAFSDILTTPPIPDTGTIWRS